MPNVKLILARHVAPPHFLDRRSPIARHSNLRYPLVRVRRVCKMFDVLCNCLCRDASLHRPSPRSRERRRISATTPPNRSSSAENASVLSAAVGWKDSTRAERPTARTTCCHTMVLPIPASPVTASAAGAPEAAERKAEISAISPSRHLARPGSGPFPPLQLGCNRSGHRGDPSRRRRPHLSRTGISLI